MAIRALVLACIATVSLVGTVTAAAAQGRPGDPVTLAPAGPAADTDTILAPLSLPAEIRQAVLSLDQTPRLERPRPASASRLRPTSLALGTMYVSTAVLQGLDVHSTLRGLRDGAREANPVMKGLVDRPAVFIAMKAGVACGTIIAGRKMARKNKLAALVTLAGINALYGAVVHHNYEIGRRSR